MNKWIYAYEKNESSLKSNITGKVQMTAILLTTAGAFQQILNVTHRFFLLAHQFVRSFHGMWRRFYFGGTGPRLTNWHHVAPISAPGDWRENKKKDFSEGKNQQRESREWKKRKGGRPSGGREEESASRRPEPAGMWTPVLTGHSALFYGVSGVAVFDSGIGHRRVNSSPIGKA